MAIKPIGGEIVAQDLNDNFADLDHAIKYDPLPVTRIPEASIPSSKLKQATDADKIQPANLSAAVLSMMNGQSPTGTTPADGSVTAPKIATNAVTLDKLATLQSIGLVIGSVTIDMPTGTITVAAGSQCLYHDDLGRLTISHLTDSPYTSPKVYNASFPSPFTTTFVILVELATKAFVALPYAAFNSNIDMYRNAYRLYGVLYNGTLLMGDRDNAFKTTVITSGGTNTESKLAPRSIANNKLADNAVTGAKIEASTVTQDKLATFKPIGLVTGAVTIDVPNGTITVAAGSQCLYENDQGAITLAQLTDSPYTSPKVYNASFPSPFTTTFVILVELSTKAFVVLTSTAFNAGIDTYRNTHRFYGILFNYLLLMGDRDNAFRTTVITSGGTFIESKLPLRSISANKIADRTLTGTQIADSSVTLDKLSRAELIRNYPLSGNALGYRATDGGLTNFNAVNGANTIRQLFFFGKYERYYIKAFYRRHSGNNTRAIEIWDKDNQDYVRFNAPAQYDGSGNIVYPVDEYCPLTDSAGTVRGVAVISWPNAPNIADYKFTDTELHASCFLNLEKAKDLMGVVPIDYGITFYTDPVYRLAVGREFNIYFDSIVTVEKPSEVFYRVTAPTLTAGTNIKHYDECIRVTPTADKVGSHTVTIQVYKLTTNEVLSSQNITLNIIADDALAAPLKVMFLGDSLTEQGRLAQKAKESFGENFVCYGTQGTAPYNHEGRSSWSANDYLTLAERNGRPNPFFNPSTQTFDFGYYMTNNPQFADVQVVNVFLGRNDGYTATAVSRISTIVERIKAYNPDIVVTVMMGYHTGLTNGGAGRWMQNTWIYRNSTFVINAAFRSTFGGREAEGIYLVPQYVNLDTVYDYPHEQEQVSQRNTDTLYRITDNVHPNDAGYWKFADVWYNYMQYIRTQI